MDLSDSRARDRAVSIVTTIVIGIGLATALMFAGLRYRDWNNARAQRGRLAIAASVHVGMNATQVEMLLGKATFAQAKIGGMFIPDDPICRKVSVTSAIYQGMPERTLVVFFDDRDRVTCVETTTAFMIMHR